MRPCIEPPLTMCAGGTARVYEGGKERVRAIYTRVDWWTPDGRAYVR